MASRVRLVITRLVLIFILTLDFYGRIRIVRSMYLPAALHGIDSSLLASDMTVCGSFGPLSAGFSGHDVKHMGLMGLLGVTPLFVWYGSGFGCFVGISLFGLLRLVEFIIFWSW